ncbi:MAG TPA: endonuclease/exonuclease/phosphatase family protein [Devosiaceae bacterium]|jgi:endonuclease/exonuclease/phosphatase (EEP) superfamily protein YafD|nr:endonuclease/exonuclease/phosphatase family protein [Devosiaceae bacterium]
MRLLIGLVRLGIGLGTAGVSLLALLALLGFASPVLDLFNHAQVFLLGGTLVAFVLVLLLFRGRWRSWLAGIGAAGLLASAVTVMPEAISSFAPRPPLPAEERPVLTLMTHNLFGMNYEMERVAALITEEDPDFVVLQEYFPEQSGELHPLLRERYPHYARCRGGKRANLGLYAKLPFEEASDDGSCPDDAYGSQRTARIIGSFVLTDGTPLTVMTTHLDWPVPVARQVEQFADLGAAVRAVEGPLVLAGDFNSTPWSYALRGFAERAGLVRETRNLATFPNRFLIRRMFETLPFLPLDHVFSTGGVAVHEVWAGADTGSDHLPVFARFTVEP